MFYPVKQNIFLLFLDHRRNVVTWTSTEDYSQWQHVWEICNIFGQFTSCKCIWISRHVKYFWIPVRSDWQRHEITSEEFCFNLEVHTSTFDPWAVDCFEQPEVSPRVTFTVFADCNLSDGFTEDTALLQLTCEKSCDL